MMFIGIVPVLQNHVKKNAYLKKEEAAAEEEEEEEEEKEEE